MFRDSIEELDNKYSKLLIIRTDPIICTVGIYFFLNLSGEKKKVRKKNVCCVSFVQGEA